MVPGFSGNLGYPMPTNWAFGQFIELTIGSGDGGIGIDKNDYSGRDEGVSSVNPPQFRSGTWFTHKHQTAI